MSALEPLIIAPLPERIGHCPEGHGPLTAERVHVAGWRTLARGRCGTCGHTFLQDLPAGHGLIYPATLNLDTGETRAEPQTSWFSAPLRSYYESPDAGTVEVEVVRRRRGAGAVVLLNCLDVIYGHALLKLLNAGRHREEHCIVLVPAALEAMVPDHVAEVWMVQAGFGRLSRWLLELEEWVAERLTEPSGGVALSPAFPHPHPSTYRLDEHVAGVEPRRQGDPSIVLALRDDRRWGRTAAAETRNLRRFMCRVRETHPGAGFTAVGVGAARGLPSAVDDRRAASPDTDRERDWLAVLLGADLAVGVHGSNLLLPSGLAGATLELLPRERYANFPQATLISERDPLAALNAHRTVYGNRHLSDIGGGNAGAIAALLLAELPRFREVMVGPLAGTDSRVAGSLDPASADPDLAPASVRRVLPPLRRAAGRTVEMTGTAAVLARRAFTRARARRAPAPPLVLTDSRGASFELTDRSEVSAFFEHRGHFEAAEIDLMRRYLCPGDTAIDVGANLGHFTATMARAVSPGGEVHAFEPLADNRERLRRTLELNGLTNVRVEAAALGAATGEVLLTDYGPGYGSWATVRPRESDPRAGAGEPAVSRTVPQVTLDEYAAAKGLEQIAALKVDVEGAELDVLAGAARLLEATLVDLLLVEVSDNTLPEGSRAWELVERLAAPPLRSFVLVEGRLVPFRAAGRLEFASVISLTPAGRARLGV